MILADAAETGLDAGAYDTVMIIMSLHHIREAEPVLSEAFRLMKPDGRFILIDRLAKDKKLAKEHDNSVSLVGEIGHKGDRHTQRTEAELEAMLSGRFRILKKEEMPYDDDKAEILTRWLYCLGKG